MQTLFTRLTSSQFRKNQIYRRTGFKVAVTTVGGIEIALGQRDSKFGVFQYNKRTHKVGKLISVISPHPRKVVVWHPLESVVPNGSPEMLGEYYLAMHHIFCELQKETER